MGDDDEQPVSIGHLLLRMMDDGDPAPTASDADEPPPHDKRNSQATPNHRPYRGAAHIARGGLGRRPRRRGLYPRNRIELRIDQLVGALLSIHGVTDEVRLRCVYMYWRQIFVSPVGRNTVPDSITDGVLTVYVRSSAWMQEVRFAREQMIARVNQWVAERRRWLGAHPFVSDIRFVLGSPREPLVEPEHLRSLIRRTRERQPGPDREPPAGGAPGPARDAILAASSLIQDPELRRIVEDVRTRWDR